jgi:hypothetical protein
VQDLIGGHTGAIVGVGVGIGAGIVTYVLVQALLGAPELPRRLQLGAARMRESERAA